MNKLTYVLLTSSIITITTSAITINLEELDELIEQNLADFRSISFDNQEAISNENIFDYAKIFAAQYFASQGKKFDQLPKIVKNKILVVCQEVANALQRKLTNVKQTAIHKTHIQKLVKGALQDITDEMSIMIPANQIAQAVNENIITFFIDNGFTVAQIPTSMQEEFDARTAIIITNLNNLMLLSNQHFVTLADIQSAIQASLGAFIERMQYVLLWQWVLVQVAQIKSTPNQTPSSYVPPMDAESKKLYKSLKRLKK